ncbi:hypothetical protein [Streptomyces sp. NPDC056987]|uniref:hypothetical protein n=1 Tax=Streptomyces sp. NPDC056987 TaxID=3345988 RepID=UPI003643A7F5
MKTTPSSYRVHAVLTSGGLWNASVETLPEVSEHDRSLSKLNAKIRKAIALQGENLNPEELTLEVITSTGDASFDQALAEARTLRHRADELAEQARTKAAPLAQRLVQAGVSQRDAGTLLSVSAALVSSMTKS